MMTLDQTRIEYESWKKLVAELRTLGVEINNQNELTSAIKIWGIEFARLAKENPALLEK